MKGSKNGNLVKLVAFFLIAVLLTMALALSSGGWLITDKEPDSDNVKGDGTPNDKFDENNDGENSDNTENGGLDNIPEVKPIPDYLHYITGLEITSEESFIKPICYVYDSVAPIYGISSSMLTVEMPTEDGKTRFLVFSNNSSSAGKIGSLAPSRKYMNNVVSAFGGILASFGNDDNFEYNGTEFTDNYLNFESNKSYYYTEYNDYIYTNANLLTSFLKAQGISTVKTTTPVMPFEFVGYYDEKISLKEEASTILIPFSSGNSSEFSYSKEEGRYYFYKNATKKTDLLNDEALKYDNIFVLSSDSVTYETENATETIMDTKKGGVGYYATGGKMVKILWETDIDGNLVFKGEDGNILTVNRGISYISFIKSSKISSVVFN